MQLIKFIATVTLLIMTATSNSQSLNKNNYKQIAQKNAEGMKGMLKLSDAQAKQVKGIEEKFFTELLMPSRDSAHLEIRILKIELLQKQREDMLQKVLTPAQWNQYETHIIEQKRKNFEAMEERKRKYREKLSNTNG